MITQSELKKFLEYHLDTGDFTWKVSRGNVKAGKVAGFTEVNGYLIIRINNNNYYAHIYQ